MVFGMAYQLIAQQHHVHLEQRHIRDMPGHPLPYFPRVRALLGDRQARENLVSPSDCHLSFSANGFVFVTPARSMLVRLCLVHLAARRQVLDAGRHGDVIALGLVAVQLSQDVKLGRGFDAVGDDGQPGRVCHGDDAGDDRLGSGRLAESGDDAPVDLESVQCCLLYT